MWNAGGFILRKINNKDLKALKNQLEKHNKSVRANRKKMTLSKLRRSFDRGRGAFFTSPSQRIKRGITSSSQWALGRTQTLLKAVKDEDFKNIPFDRDLIPKGNKAKK